MELDMDAKDLHLNWNVEEDSNEENIPDYLSSASSSFKATFLSELHRYYNPINFEDLQYLAILTHKLIIVNLYRKLWHIYIQCGTGQLKQRPNLTKSFCIWSHQLTSMIIAQQYNNITDQNEITHDVYLNFVKKNLFYFGAKASQYQFQVDSTQDRVDNGSDALIYKIDEFVQKNDYVTCIRLYFEGKIALIEYTYLDQLLQYEYLQQNSNEHQIGLARNICTVGYEKEQSEQELILIKIGVLYNNLLDSLNRIEESPPTSIITLMDPKLRKPLLNNYIRIIQRAKADLMTVLTTAAEIKKEEHQKKFDRVMAKLWTDQHHLPNNERLTTTMLSLIDERLKNILECVKRIYAIKADFCVKIPTIHIQNNNTN
ncbi:unnamed protein product [Rotaria sordida]|uniref:Uncharacterized protein n=1 Tax=Rotaria sordida TaxID=392033 RepID=A0A818VGC8_9BILA|nr:unnamed protein product [Rotaria sordida]CAF1172897.1 unnamed protein product [Rotaria sordida]CAF3676649.1 unnamed protein product [Rotaria sordida]CAF3705926.1 unnamed protein product [Rotaria sordida]